MIILWGNVIRARAFQMCVKAKVIYSVRFYISIKSNTSRIIWSIYLTIFRVLECTVHRQYYSNPTISFLGQKMWLAVWGTKRKIEIQKKK